MKTCLKLFFLFFIFISIQAFAQEKTADSKTEKKNDVESRKLKRKKAKAAWNVRRGKERGNRHAIKSNEKRLQTKETRKRMKKNRAKANRTNQNKNEPLLIRLFKPKPRT
jgi:hypothetical protein